MRAHGRMFSRETSHLYVTSRISLPSYYDELTCFSDDEEEFEHHTEI